MVNYVQFISNASARMSVRVLLLASLLLSWRILIDHSSLAAGTRVKNKLFASKLDSRIIAQIASHHVVYF
jgi:hypothetical protein